MTVTATPSVLKAIAINPKAGYCVKCLKWRYCEHQLESGKIICNSCVQILKNQKLFSLIVPAPIAPTVRAEKVKRKRNKKPPKQLTIKRNILPEAEKLLRDSLKGMSALEIKESLNLSYRWTLVILERLIKQKVIACSGGKRNRIYIHTNHAEILKNYQGVPVGFRKDTIAIKEAIDNVPDVVSAIEIKNRLVSKKSKSCVLNKLRFLAVRGDVLTFFDEEKDTEYFASTANEIAVQKFQEAISNNFENRLLRCLESGEKSRPQIAKLLGKHKRSVRLITKVLNRLEAQKKVQVKKVGSCFLYKLKVND